MLFTKDMRDLVSIFTRHKVKFALVGGFAVNFYGYVRMTQDIDFLVYPSRKNAEKIMRALFEFGFGAAGIPESLFEKAGSAVHLGVEPNRIDLLTRLKGVDNNVVFANVRHVAFEGIRLPIISRKDLIQAKRGSSRKKDLADVEELETINKRRKSVKERSCP